MRKNEPLDDTSTGSTLLCRAMPRILKIAIIGGGVAMIHWALDMGPGFAALYLGALAAMLATATWHVVRSPAPAAIDRAAVTDATPRRSNEAAPQLPRDPPSRANSPTVNAIAVGFGVAVRAFFVPADQLDWSKAQSARVRRREPIVDDAYRSHADAIRRTFERR